MKAGNLRHRVTIQRSTDALDATTQEITQTWTTLATVWAEVLDMSGSERFRAAQVQPGATVTVRIRYRDDVTSKMRIRHGSRYLNIESVIDMEGRNRERLLICSEQR